MNAILVLTILLDTSYPRAGITTVWIRAEYTGHAYHWRPLLTAQPLGGPVWFGGPVEPDWQDGRFAWWLFSGTDQSATFSATVEETP